MKKILLSILCIGIPLFTSSGVAHIHAATTVIVTEKVPGANCVPYGTPTYSADGATQSLKPADFQEYANLSGTRQNTDGSYTLSDGTRLSPDVQSRKYECTVGSGLAGFQNMFAQIIKWFVNIVMILGVLAIVGLGIAWSLAGGDDAKTKTGLKKWAINIFVGMMILFFFRYILQFLAPWIYQ